MSSLNQSDFIHLHLHSKYSILDGAIRLDDLFKQCKKFEMSSVAITDHGNFFGAIEFYTKATKAAIKPIIGSEIYITPNTRLVRGHGRSPEGRVTHLTLLAMNQTGYRNLIQLSSISYLKAGDSLPTINYPLLEKYNEGLIVLSGCVFGEIPSLILQNSMDKAKGRALYLRMIFGNRFYLELQENGTQKQKDVNAGLLHLSKDLRIPVVATNNCHYLTREDAVAQEVLLRIKTKKRGINGERSRYSTRELYFKGAEEMVELFRDIPEAIVSTKEIADRCNLELNFDNSFYPSVPLPKGSSEASVLKKLANKGLKKHLLKLHLKVSASDSKLKSYQNRIAQELSIIIGMGYAGYFLIVHDFVFWAKNNRIPVGPGRGSGVGSLVAYCLGITEIDPVHHNLLFERFLNNERQSPPDLDIDFCRERRGEVLQYISEKYGGKQRVAHLITFGLMKAGGAVRDVGKVLGIPVSTIESIVKNFPKDSKMTLEEIFTQSPRLQKIANSSLRNQQLFSIARKLEGLPRYKSIHPSGIIIFPVPLTNQVPLCVSKNGDVISQFGRHSTEALGFIKFDLLGLNTLTVINLAIKLIEKDFGVQIDLQDISLDDNSTYTLLQKGETTGVFQLESCGMRKLLKQIRPQCFDDLVAVVALYRPGPLAGGMKTQYLKARSGKIIKQVLPQVKPILAATHGVILYQEQVMKIAHVVASFTMGEADMLRHAMTKKDQKLMATQKEKFIAGAIKNKIQKVKAIDLFAQMAMFAKYAFNKSHSTAYALLSYRTAYLKVHYPVQFMAAFLSCSSNNKRKHEKYRQASRNIRSPDKKD